MKQLVCEMCGGTDLIKQDGVFVCQSCGIKYTVEEARKMMVEVEGVVEVTGTVKVDNSDSVEKLLINADRAYEDGRFREAEKIYASVLEIDTENVRALYRKGMATSQQGNIADGSIGIAGKTAIRAIECMYEQGERYSAEEKSVLLTLIMTEVGTLGQKILEYALRRQLNALQEYNSTIQRLNEKVWDLPADYVRECANRAEREKNEEVKTGQVLKDLSLSMVLAVLLEGLTRIEKEEDEDIRGLLYSAVEVVLTQIEDSCDETKSVIEMYAAVKAKLTVGVKNITEAQNRRKQEAIDAYWEEHKAEKEALVEESEKLRKEQKELQAKTKEANTEISKIVNKLVMLVPAEKEQTTVFNTINKLKNERNSLGFFKGKEKKLLDEQIEAQQNIYDSYKDMIAIQRKELKEECETQKNEVKERLKPTKKRLSEVEKRLREISDELTKER